MDRNKRRDQVGVGMRSRQRGQSLPLTIALTLVVTLAGLVLFNTGQITSEKARVTNAADAAVYSGLVWQARALNFQAYTNRAMVANQVSIAQMVSLSSWSEMHRIGSRNLEMVAGWIPMVGQIISAYRQTASYVDSIVQAIVQNAVPVLDQLNGLLSEAQQNMYVSTFLATPAVVKKVVERNDPGYEVTSSFSVGSLADNARRWGGFVERYEADRQGPINRKANLIRQSRDYFTKRRYWHFPGGIIGPDGSKGPLYQLTKGYVFGSFYKDWWGFPFTFRARITKDGTTRLIQHVDDQTGEITWQWKAKDTMSLHHETWKWKLFGSGWKHRETPIGWASRYVGDENCPNRIMRWSPWSWGDDDYEPPPPPECRSWGLANPRAEEVAAHSNAAIAAVYSGLRAYFDLQNLAASNRDPRLVLRVQVDAPAGTIRTSTHINGLGSPHPPTASARRGGLAEQGMFYAGDHYAADAETGRQSVSSVAAGEVFFKRPVYQGTGNALFVNGQRKREYASLFNPYWEVRLSDVTDEVRTAAWLFKDPGLMEASASGVSAGGAAYRDRQIDDVERLQREAHNIESVLAVTSDPDKRQRLGQRLSLAQAGLSHMNRSLSQGQVRLHQVRSRLLASLQQGHQLKSALGRGGSLAGARASLPTYSSTGLVRTALNSGVNNHRLIEQQAISFVRDQVKNAVKGSLISAARGAVTSGLSSYGGDLYRQAQSLADQARTTVEAAEGAAGALSDGLGQAREALRNDIEAWQGELDARVDEVTQRFDQQQAAVEQTLDDLVSQLPDAADERARQALQERIDAQRDKLEQLAADKDRAVDAEIARYRTRIESVSDQIDGLLTDAERNSLDAAAVLDTDTSDVNPDAPPSTGLGENDSSVALDDTAKGGWKRARQ